MLLNPQEHLIHVFRKHWIIFVFELILFAIVAALPVAAVWVGLSIAQVTLLPNMLLVLQVIGAAWLLFVWIAFFIVFTDHYLDVWILTNERLIDAEQKGLFGREIAVVRTEKIEDVMTKVTGIFPSIFGYGDVHVQSAGAEREFVLRSVNNPKLARDLIMKEQERKANEVKNVRVVT